MGVLFGTVTVSGEGSPAPVAIDDPVFREPWEAQAFAMTVLLHQRGLFTWVEWAEALSAQIAGGEGPYYQQWLSALETLVASKGLSTPEELTRYQHAWEHAAHRTPHGMSIDLHSEDIAE
jgi:nitrile hydratase accessory protein